MREQITKVCPSESICRSDILQPRGACLDLVPFRDDVLESSSVHESHTLNHFGFQDFQEKLNTHRKIVNILTVARSLSVSHGSGKREQLIHLLLCLLCFVSSTMCGVRAKYAVFPQVDVLMLRPQLGWGWGWK